MEGLSFRSAGQRNKNLYLSLMVASLQPPARLRHLSSPSPLTIISLPALIHSFQGFPPVHGPPLPFALFAACSSAKPSFLSLTPPALDGFFHHALLHHPHYLARCCHFRSGPWVCYQCHCRWADRVRVSSFQRPVSTAPFQTSPEFSNCARLISLFNEILLGPTQVHESRSRSSRS